MLVSVHIENIALIKNINLEIGRGFTVLTGETGAGKSILVDSISLLCGARGDKSIIRTGEDQALVEGVFSDLSPTASTQLAELDIYPDEDGFVYLSRRLSSDGRSVARINGRQVPLFRLKEVADILIALHGQQDTQVLAEEKKQLALLDAFAANSLQLQEYQREYNEYTSLIKKQQKLKQAEEDKTFRLEIIKHKINEIEKAALSVKEEEELKQERVLLINTEKIIQSANLAFDNLYRTGNSIADRLEATISALQSLTDIIPETAEMTERITEIKYELEDISDRIMPYTNPEEGDPAKRLDVIEERLEYINTLKRKYKKDIPDILTELEDLKSELDTIEYSAEILAKLKEDLIKQEQTLKGASDKLNQSRYTSAKVLENKVEETLTFLDMPGVKFVIDFIDGEYTPTGNTSTNFLISANIGEEPKPISKVASGGELSRLMLALKSIVGEKDYSVMIFDEIDSGISGKTSDKIGMKLSETAVINNCQVICVTHSAQIASRGQNHLLITKSESEGRTSTKVTDLKGEDRVTELARIIGGVSLTETVIKTAREMLSKNTQYI